MRNGLYVFVMPSNCHDGDRFYNVGEAELLPSGALCIRDLDGELMRTYGPTGYIYYETERP